MKRKIKKANKMKRVLMLTATVLCACAAHAADYSGSNGGEGWSTIGTTCLVVAGIGLIAFCLAYPKAKRGELVVYASWADFGMSLLWIPLAGLGIFQSCGFDATEDGVGMAIAIIVLILGIVSAFWLVWGAFKHNRGAYACIVSLGARVFLAFLFILAMSKLTEGKKILSGEGNGDNAAAAKAAILALAICGFIFAKLIKPMIGTRTTH